MEDKLYTALSASTSITSVVGTRIYPVQLPQSPTMPAITYQRITSLPFNDIGGKAESHIRSMVTVQVDTWGTTYKGTKNLARSIWNVLDATTAFKAILQTDSDFLETLGDSEQIYRVMQEYLCSST